MVFSFLVGGIVVGIALLVSFIAYNFLNEKKRANSTNTCNIGYFALPETMLKNIRKYNAKDFVHIWFVNRFILLAIDHKSAKFLLTNKEKFVKNVDRGPYTTRYLFSKNLFGSDGADWRRQRVLYAPAFQNEAYKMYYPVFDQMTDKFISKLEEAIPKGDVDVVPFLHKFTLDLLGKSIFNYEFGSMDDQMNDYYESYKVVLGNAFGFLYGFMPWLDRLSFIPRTRLIHYSHDKLLTLFDKLITEHKKRENEKADILAHLIGATDDVYGTLSREELISNVFILFLAGHETTSSAIAWTIYMLTQHPEWQDKLRAEIKEKIGDRHPTIEDFNDLTLVDNFISEVLRIHPPVASMISRSAAEDVTYNDVFIPKGSLMGLNIHAIHMNENYWPEPEKFDPDRFLSENKKGMKRFAYLPFSLGPRQCIGNRFSLIEQHLVLVRLLQEFEILLPQHNKISIARKIGNNFPDVLHVHLKKLK